MSYTPEQMESQAGREIRNLNLRPGEMLRDAARQIRELQAENARLREQSGNWRRTAIRWRDERDEYRERLADALEKAPR